MRMLMKISFGIEAGNARIKDGSLAKMIGSILEELKPEAAYFTELEGVRSALVFLDLKEASDIPRIAEPWFLALNARVELHPVMKIEDLQKAGPAIEQAAKNYG